MKKMLKDYGIFISELYRTDKPYIIFYIVMIILKAASPFALIIFPKYLLNEITGLNRMDYIIRYLIAMGATSILINVILNLVEPFLDRRLQHLQINNPDASVGAQCSTFRTVCSHKVVAVGFNTLCYDASVGVLNPPHESSSAKNLNGRFSLWIILT